MNASFRIPFESQKHCSTALQVLQTDIEKNLDRTLEMVEVGGLFVLQVEFNADVEDLKILRTVTNSFLVDLMLVVDTIARFDE